MKKNLKKGVSKKRQNEVAIQMATKDDEHIYYDYNHPLVINENCKIAEMYVANYEGNDSSSYFDTDKVIKIIFVDREKSRLDDYTEKVPYQMEIRTILSLDEFEEQLTMCDDEVDIEELDDLF